MTSLWTLTGHLSITLEIAWDRLASSGHVAQGSEVSCFVTREAQIAVVAGIAVHWAIFACVGLEVLDIARGACGIAEAVDDQEVVCDA